MTQQEKEYYQKIRRRFEDEQKIAMAVKGAFYLILIGMVFCWMWNQ